MTSYPQYWDTSILFPETHKVCALCDRNFPVAKKQVVEVTTIDSKPVKDVTSPKTTMKTFKHEVGVIS